MNTGDATYIRHLNRKIILEKIMQHKNISRAELAKITGLNKATVSSQISTLLEENLLYEKHSDISSGGRKPIILSINESAGYSLGIDIDTSSINLIVTDLVGSILYHSITPLDEHGFTYIENLLISLIKDVKETLPDTTYGIVGIGIGVHGIVKNNQLIVFTPYHQWRNVDLKASLETTFQIPVAIENNANLCALAEQVYSEKNSNLVCVTTYSGIGLGIIFNHQLFKGFDGFAGEVGHMIIEPEGVSCSCGNKGCWEQYASEKVLLNTIASKMDLEVCTVEDINRWVQAEHVLVEAAIEEYSRYLAIGLNNIINFINPETVILNSDLFSSYPDIVCKIQKYLTSSMNHYKDIRASTLGKNACVLGGSALAMKDFFGVDLLNFS
ncbi:ROK family transcriptional regulator [Sutcliffiella halmapala]|uniref:ROK family transcriptional regulator n=1 Tax=Sutcliffiella halmapala TaxID=79882 RepID=UPI0014727E29|nr:ROK family transcriptional regulator [Sutcliffiella halmapala]